MKLLEKVRVTNADKTGNMTFTQVKMVETKSLNCYIYRRNEMDGTLFCYEAFASKRRKKGDKLPGGLVELEDRERWPTCHDFGFTAKDAGKSLGVAEVFLAEFVVKMNEKADKANGVKNDVEPVEGDGFMEALNMKMDITPKVRGRKRKERPNIAYPVTDQWVMRDVLKVNPLWTQPLAYIQMQKDKANGLVVEVARVKNASGRGRAMVVYSTSKTVGDGREAAR